MRARHVDTPDAGDTVRGVRRGGTTNENAGRRLLVGAAIAGVWLTVSAAPAAGNTYRPTRFDDPSPGACKATDCSLREAVRAGNARAGADVIVLKQGHYNLTITGADEAAAMGDLDVTDTLAVRRRAGDARPVIDANDHDRIFDVQSAGAQLSISRVVLRDGAGGAQSGGAIRNSTSGGLGVRVSHTELLSNAANGGGAIFSLNRVVALSSTFRRNDAGGGPGGGIDVASLNTKVDASDSRFINNKASGGGGIFNEGPVVAPRSTFTRNDGGSDPGGGIDVASSGYEVDVTKGRFTANKASGGGGVFNGGPVFARGSRFIGNDGGANPGGGIDLAAAGYRVQAGRSVFQDNDASGGGAIFNGGRTLAAHSLFLRDDAHSNPGGAIDAASSGYLVDATGSRFTSNDGEGGGAIFNGGTVKARGASFRGNDAHSNPGGAIDVASAGFTVDVTGGKVLNNDGEGGGGIFNGGAVKAGNAVFGGNDAHSSPGGGIFVGTGGKTVTFPGARFTLNTGSDGGAIYNAGPSTATRATVANNHATSGGGGAIFTNGSLTLSRSTLSGNTATVDGGAISNFNGTVNLTNATLSGNSADGSGGGMDSAGGIANVTLNNATVSANTANADGVGGQTGGGLSRGAGSFTVKNSIVAGNTTGAAAPGRDCSGSFTSGGHNVVKDTTACAGFGVMGDVTGQSAKLGPLADNGGPTLTRALLAGSPAIGLGGPDTATRDQRGVPRSDADSGAYELVKCMGTVVNRVGTDGSDRIRGTNSADGFLAFGGNDRIFGRKGGDHACAGGGDDRVFGGDGNDVLAGQAGDDLLDGGVGTDTCIGGSGTDALRSCEQ
jgi:predicted outer membrane repeat protein